MPAAEPAEFAVGPAPVLRGSAAGEGTPIVLCHGLTASRRYVVHGSRALERGRAPGHHLRRPRPRRVRPRPGRAELWIPGADRATSSGWSRPRSARSASCSRGHSMGAHTAVGYALAHPERLSGLVIIGPTYTGEIAARVARLLGRAGGGAGSGRDRRLRRLPAAARAASAEAWRDSVARISAERMGLHRDPPVLARALRETPASRPFGSLEELAGLDVPALVVASGRRGRSRPSLRGRRGLRGGLAAGPPDQRG